MTRLRARFFSLLGSALILGVITPVAAADQPMRTQVPPTGSRVLPGGGGCGFPLLLEGILEKQKILDFGDHAIITGVLQWRFTNPANSKSIEINLSGPTHTELTEDGQGFVARHVGRTLFSIGPAAAARLGLGPGMFLSTGLVVVEGNRAVGVTSIVQAGGTWTPICPELA